MSKPSSQSPPGAGLATVERTEPGAGRKPRLVWQDGEGAHDVTVEERAVAGSAPGTDVCVADRTVSRLHADLDPRPDGLWVRDLGSRNGTFIDNVRIESGRVPNGRSLRLGGVAIEVTYEKTEAPRDAPWPSDRFGPLVGGSLVMRHLFARLDRVARTSASVLILGETGTGKELVARSLHEASERSSGPLIVVDCAALPESLIESELFGHTRGAFTGASEARPGAIAAADGGTVFLDEIGELPLSVQPKLLRVLERREVRPVGAAQHRTVDVRFVSATHRDLRRLVNEGAFREDLYFRLAVVPIVVPPLRDRPEDVAQLVRHLAPRGASHFDDAFLAELARRPWLGNVRELRNFVERAFALGTDEALALDAAHAAVSPLPAPPASPSSTAPAAASSLEGPYKEARERWLDDFEKAYFKRLLDAHGRNVSEAARDAGVDRTYVYRMIRRHGL